LYYRDLNIDIEIKTSTFILPHGMLYHCFVGPKTTNCVSKLTLKVKIIFLISSILLIHRLKL